MSKRILVIDDDEAVRKAFALRLDGTGYQVDTAESGEKGIDLFKGGMYDLVFLDLKMPGLNGVDTLRELRQLNSDIPVYIVTAFHDQFFDQLRKAKEEKIDFEVLRKPIEGEELVVVTESILGNHIER